jgi:RNA polymerase sigma-70 factor (ECF subfamily)
MQNQTISDRQLLSQSRNGNEAALELLVARHKDKIYTSIYLFVKDTYLAEDIFQETFIKVIDTLRRDKYKEEGKFLPWVMRIARNLCIDHFRKTKRTPTITTGEGYDIFNILKFEEDNAEDNMIQDQSHQRVRDLVNQLPEEQREVVVLRHYAQLSFKEIARLTDVSINTALGRMRYALINMRKMIEEKQIAL